MVCAVIVFIWEVPGKQMTRPTIQQGYESWRNTGRRARDQSGQSIDVLFVRDEGMTWWICFIPTTGDVYAVEMVEHAYTGRYVAFGAYSESAVQRLQSQQPSNLESVNEILISVPGRAPL